MTRTTCVTLIALAALGLALVSSAHAADPLPSWRVTRDSRIYCQPDGREYTRQSGLDPGASG